VQELVDFFQQSVDAAAASEDGVVDMVLNMMHLDDLSKSESNPEQSIVLNCTVQGKHVVFLLDSGSNNSFLNASLANNLSGHRLLSSPRRVKVAGGGILHCTKYIPQCQWSCGEQQFYSSFKILPL